MSDDRIPLPASPNTGLQSSSISEPASSSIFDRVGSWASENRTTAYTIAGAVVIVSGAGIVYYYSSSSRYPTDEKKRPSKKERRRAKQEKSKNETVPSSAPPAAVEPDPLEGVPDVDEDSVEQLSNEEREAVAAKLKLAGNKAYGDKNYSDAIGLYGKAILCKPDPIFYSNRAACFNALGDWEKVVEDTTAAININSEYVKALNRRANAYEHLQKYREALTDYTASCMIDAFRNNSSTESVERILKTITETKGKEILAKKEKRLPSPTFIANYLQSFRSKPRPQGLEATADLDDETGKGQLRAGLDAVEKGTAEGYKEAATSFHRAVELDDLGEHEALAYNMRGTFGYLRGDNQDGLSDLTKSIEQQPSLTQSYIKRASVYLESGDRDAANKDFASAVEQNPDDPDIYYHRAQLNFITNEFSEAARDYQKSIDLDSDFLFSHIQLGVTQYKMGSIASSMATFRRCMKNFSKVPDVYNHYGELLLDQQKYQEAVEKFDTAIEVERHSKPLGMNVLPLVNKALALFQWKQDYDEAEKLCHKALIIDPECDIALGVLAQLHLQQGKNPEALEYFEKAAEISRTEGEILSALSYAEATRAQCEVQQRYPHLQERLQQLGGGIGAVR